MSRLLLGTACILIGLGCQAGGSKEAIKTYTQIQGQPKIYAFTDTPPGRPPVGFAFDRTGNGPLGKWQVNAEAGAPNRGQVLMQIDTNDTDFRYPLAVASQPRLKNLRLSAQCKMISGRVDQAAGLVFRYQDAGNYYLTRANALEGNVRLYRIVKGKRHQMASWSGQIAANTWNDYRVDVLDGRMDVYWNGQRVIAAQDDTFAEPGRIGVWTKADSLSAFDELSVVELAPKS